MFGAYQGSYFGAWFGGSATVEAGPMTAVLRGTSTGSFSLKATARAALSVTGYGLLAGTLDFTGVQPLSPNGALVPLLTRRRRR